MTKLHQDLTEEVESAIQSILAASHRVVTAALDEAFANSGLQLRVRKGEVAKAVRRRSAARRSPQEIEALGEQLYQAVCKTPGETMAVLAEGAGVTPRVFQVPVARLKQAGRIKTVGARQSMRYFPLVSA